MESEAGMVGTGAPRAGGGSALVSNKAQAAAIFFRAMKPSSTGGARRVAPASRACSTARLASSKRSRMGAAHGSLSISISAFSSRR